MGLTLPRWSAPAGRTADDGHRGDRDAGCQDEESGSGKGDQDNADDDERQSNAEHDLHHASTFPHAERIRGRAFHPTQQWVMDEARGIACRIGCHRWTVVTAEDMQVRTCTRCGRRRYHSPLPGKDPATAAILSVALLLRHVGDTDSAVAVEKAVAADLSDRGDEAVSTSEVAARIRARLHVSHHS